MNILQLVYEKFKRVECVKNLYEMFDESWTNTKTIYNAFKNRSQNSAMLLTGIAELDAQAETLQRKLVEIQSSTHWTQRDKYFAIPAETRIIYAHNRWLTTPKILVFTPTSESIGIMFQLLHDSLQLARFLKRYEARNCCEEDYESSDFIVQARRFAGLRTAQNAYGKDMPLLIEWSLRRDPRGPLLIWNYSRDSAGFCPKYRHNVEVLSSRALFGDMPDDDATKRILTDATRRAMGDGVFSTTVKNYPKIVVQMRKLTCRYSNQPGDPADKRLPEVFRRWMKEVDPKIWMQELPVESGQPYWEALTPTEPSQEELRIELDLNATNKKKAQLAMRLQSVATEPKLFDLVAKVWTTFWLGLGVAFANLTFGFAVLVVTLICAYVTGGCCCIVGVVYIAMIIISAINSDDTNS